MRSGITSKGIFVFFNKLTNASSVIISYTLFSFELFNSGLLMIVESIISSKTTYLNIMQLRSFHLRKSIFSVFYPSTQHKRIYELSIHRRFYNARIKSKRKIVTPWIRRVGFTLSASICALFSWLYYHHHEEENWRRSLYFWGNLYPVYLHYRFVDLWTKNAEPSHRDKTFQHLHERYKHKIYNIVIHLQGFYVKLGQIGAARTDVVPIQWVELLRQLEDQCPYQPFDIIEHIIKTDFDIDDTSQIFEYIDPIPLGAASIGQTHFARLNTGEEVVIKVQYPNVEQLFRGDFRMARKFCEMAQPAHLPFLDETEKQFLTEFDYVLEAKNLEEIGNNLNTNVLWKDKVVVPRPYTELCTQHVLTMQYLKGKKLITALKENFTGIAKEKGLTLDELIEEQKALNIHPSAEQMAGIHRKIVIRDRLWNMLAMICNYSFGVWFWLLGHPSVHFIEYKHSILPLNSKLILDLVSSVHAYEIFMDGAFNGDPHPGNILICEDGKLGLIDYGQVKHLEVQQRIDLAKLMVYLAANDRDKIIQQIVQMGLETKYMDEWVIEKSARFYFDSDGQEVTEGMNAQLFLEYLQKRDPVTHLSDDFVMVGRLRILLSGLHFSLGYTFSAANAWKYWAQTLLKKHNVDPYLD
eukprot:539721_1